MLKRRTLKLIFLRTKYSYYLPNKKMDMLWKGKHLTDPLKIR